jgi:hypothetical protein
LLCLISGTVITNEGGNINYFKWIISGRVDVLRNVSVKKSVGSTILEKWDSGCDPTLLVQIDVESQILNVLDSFPIIAADYKNGRNFLVSKYQFIASSDCTIAQISITKLQQVLANHSEYYDCIMQSSAVFEFEEGFLQQEFIDRQNWLAQQAQIPTTNDEPSLILSSR